MKSSISESSEINDNIQALWGKIHYPTIKKVTDQPAKNLKQITLCTAIALQGYCVNEVT